MTYSSFEEVEPAGVSREDDTTDDQGAIASDFAISDDLSTVNGVEVSAEPLSRRERRISASIWLPQSVEQIWTILTDYDHLADFIPNLDQSRKLETPDAQTTRIEQIGAECFLTLKFCARVVLDMVESFPHRIDFHMVEGDFRSFAGSWQLQPETCSGMVGTRLRYVLDVEPARLMPIALIERHLQKNLTVNLLAIRQRAEEFA